MNSVLHTNARTRNVIWVVGTLCLAAGYWIQPDGVHVRVHPRRAIDRPFWSGTLAVPDVADGSFFRQALINGYKSPPLPFPEQVPPYRVTFETYFLARTGGKYRFELDSNWHAKLAVGGRDIFGTGPFQAGRRGPAGEIELAPGAHSLVFTVQPSDNPDGRIALLLKDPTGQLRRLTKRDIVDPDASQFYSVAVQVCGPLLFAGGLLFGFGACVWVTQQEKRPARRTLFLACALLAGLASLTRVPHFDTNPRFRIDEYHNAWLGYNLLHEGVAKSWSWLPNQEKTWISWFGYRYPIVERAYDHPPLLPILTGASATVLGARTMWDCTLPRIRPIMLFLGITSVVLLFLVAKEVTGFASAFLAASLMAVSPLVVFNSRLVKEDGLVQLFLLLALLVYLKNRKRQSGTLDWLVGLFAGLAALTKIMGIAVGFGLAAVAFVERDKKIVPSTKILGMSLVVASLYPIYGLLLDAEGYSQVMSYLSTSYARESLADKLLILPRFVLEPKVAAAIPLIDGWIMLGWLSLYHLFRFRALSVVFASYLLVLMATVLSNALWGFYVVPVLPLLCLTAALSITRAIMKQDFLSVFLFLGFAFLPVVSTLPHLALPGGFRTLLVVAFLPLVPAILRLPQGHRLRDANRLVLTGFLMLAFVASIHRCVTTI